MSGPFRHVAVRRAIALVVLIALWEAASRAGLINPFYAPAPSKVAEVLATLFGDGAIWVHLQATFAAALAGLALGLVFGVVLGFAAALVPVLAELLEPVMMLLNAIPRVILAPLFVIWLGIDLGSKIALSLVLVAVLIFFAVYSGIKDVDQRLIERVKTLGGGRWVLLREVYVPSVTAWVMGSLKVAVGFAFTGAVVGEFVASSRGLGYLLQFAQSTYNAGLSLALILLIMGFVLLLFALSERLERRLLRWRYRCNFKGVDEVENLREHSRHEVERYAAYMRRQGFYAEAHFGLGTDVADEAAKLCEEVAKRFPQSQFFAGQLVFQDESFLTRWLHNHTVFELQRRLYQHGWPMLILPIQV